jgi:hypothetical protein
MKVITVESPQGHYEVPLGTRILWDTDTAPMNWQFDTALESVFVMGADEPDLTHRGAITHTHTTPGLASGGAHSDHPVNVSNVSSVSASVGMHQENKNTSVGGHSHSGTGTCTSAGAHTHTTPNTGTGSNYPPFIRLRYIYSDTSTVVPVGGIVMHNGSPTALGSGWQVCDGTNGTLDLRGKFPIYGTSEPIGSTGGFSSHAHAVGVSGAQSAEHTHSISITLSTINGGANGIYELGGATVADTHNHSGGCTSPSSGAHTHSINNTGTTNSLPPYIQLYFIKRIA